MLTASKMQLMDDLIIIRKRKPSEKSDGGVLLPTTVQGREQPNIGVVVCVGPGLPLDDGSVRPMRVALGDQVMFNPQGAALVSMDGEDCLIISEQDVTAKVLP